MPINIEPTERQRSVFASSEGQHVRAAGATTAHEPRSVDRDVITQVSANTVPGSRARLQPEHPQLELPSQTQTQTQTYSAPARAQNAQSVADGQPTATASSSRRRRHSFASLSRYALIGGALLAAGAGLDRLSIAAKAPRLARTRRGGDLAGLAAHTPLSSVEAGALDALVGDGSSHVLTPRCASAPAPHAVASPNTAPAPAASEGYPRIDQIRVAPELYLAMRDIFTEGEKYPAVKSVFDFLRAAGPNLQGNHFIIEPVERSANGVTQYNTGLNTLYVDPGSKNIVPTTPDGAQLGINSVFEQVVHECNHAESALRCLSAHLFRGANSHPVYDDLEELRVIRKVNDDLAKNTNEAKRIDHHSVYYVPAHSITDTDMKNVAELKNTTWLASFRNNIRDSYTYYSEHSQKNYAWSLATVYQQHTPFYQAANKLHTILPETFALANVKRMKSYIDKSLAKTIAFGTARNGSTLAPDQNTADLERHAQATLNFADALCAENPIPQPGFILPTIESHEIAPLAPVGAPAASEAPAARGRRLLA